MSNALFLQNGQHPAPLFSGKTKTVTITPEAVTLPRPRVVDMTPQAPAPAPVVAPAPTQPQPVLARSRADIITDLQRELSRKGFYDGAVDGVWGSRTDNALRDFLQAAGVRMSAEASEDVLRVVTQSSVAKATSVATRNDPIADMLSKSRMSAPAASVEPAVQPAPQPAAAGSRRLIGVQRALADFGYGQVKPTGTMGPDTQAAIERFERDRRLPVTGQLSDRLVRELSAVTGRPID
jgi:peptidoglycan hydrolase-like protein with peptidoglycan-binding domain